MTGWIPITTRPPNNTPVLVYDGSAVSIGLYYHAKVEIPDKFQGWIDISRRLKDMGEHITHWLPIELPEAPGFGELNARDAYDIGFAFADRFSGIVVDIHKVACNMLGDNATPENIEAWVAGFNAARRAPE